MAIKLVRQPETTDPLDERGARTWMMAQVADEVLVHGTPIPKIILLFADHRADYDVQRMVVEEPTAHVGATLTYLAGLPGVMRAF